MAPATDRRMRGLGRVVHLLIGAAAIAAGAVSSATADGPIVVKAGKLHIGNGQSIDNGIVVIVDGKIAAVGPGVPVPSDATVIDMPKGSITPGLIDANAQIEPADVISRSAVGGPGAPPPHAGFERKEEKPNVIAMMFNSNHDPKACWSCSGMPLCAFASVHETLEPEQICPCCGYPSFEHVENFISGVERSFSLTESSSEVVPHTRVIDSMNLRSPDFERLVLGGVTTVFISPDSAAVIGPQGAVVRTAGPMMDRIISAASDVKAVMGTDSFSVGADNSPPFRQFISVTTRRPNTRMGVTWVFRKAFYDTKEWKQGATPSGADTPPAEAFPQLDSILAGKTPVRMQARMQQDIRTAVRLADEFGLKFTLLEANEAYKVLDLIKERQIPVIYGPLSLDPAGVRRFAADRGDTRLSTVRELIDAGVPVALSAQDLREEDGLARQAMYAVRAGVSTGDAIKAVTQTPAKLLGIDKEVGTLESGKRADLVVWSGEPLDATSRPVMVLIGGRTVMDLREEQGSN